MLSLLLALSFCPGSSLAEDSQSPNRPHILIAVADDWGWPHAGALGDQVVRTPTFDRLAEEGVLFENAYVSSPSCTPSRAAILTGRYHWSLKESANLWSTLDSSFAVFPELLADEGYHVGSLRKGWGPGRLEPGGRTVDPAGKKYQSFEAFLEARDNQAPFCFWFGSHDPHRGYKKGSGQSSGIDVDKIALPSFYPDVPAIREDIADYYFEVERFDREFGQVIQSLEEMGELENTLVIMTSDHGMPFPRCKSNLYDWGAKVPLAVRWPGHIPTGKRLDSLVSLVDIAPTVLNAAGVSFPKEMRLDGQSLITSADPQSSAREFVIFGKERHTPCQAAPSWEGYPSRAIRFADYVYIMNLKPDLWPAGVPRSVAPSTRGPELSDCDNGPTKQFLIEHRHQAAYERFWDLSFAKRPAEEFYVLGQDPDQVRNLATEPQWQRLVKQGRSALLTALKDSEDPRFVEPTSSDPFVEYPYYGSTKQEGRPQDEKKPKKK